MDRVQVRGDGLPEMGEGMQELWIHPLPDSLLQARGWGMQGYHFFDQPDGRKVQALVSSPGKWGPLEETQGTKHFFPGVVVSPGRAWKPTASRGTFGPRKLWSLYPTSPATLSNPLPTRECLQSSDT